MEQLRIAARIPLVKLPPARFDAVMRAVAESDGTRVDAARRCIVSFGLDPDDRRRDNEKRVFRALVAPTLTRLHFARSRPPSFDAAPNGRLWYSAAPDERPAFLGQCLADLLTVRLGLSREMLGADTLRSVLRSVDTRTEDRASVFLRYLSVYPPPPTYGSRGPPAVPRPGAVRPELSQKQGLATVRRAVHDSLLHQETVGLDAVRLRAMSSAYEGGWMVSSFVIDSLLPDLITEGKECLPMLGGTNRLDALIYEGHTVVGLQRRF